MGRHARWAPALVIGLVLFSAGPALAQHRAEPGRFEVPWLDFRPDGAWRKHANAVRDNRRLLLSAGAIGAVNGAAAVTGDYKIPVVLFNFSNRINAFTPTDYSNLFFSPTPTPPAGQYRPYTLKTFYEQLSNGNITVDGSVFGPVPADSVDTFYEDGCDGIGVTPQGAPTTCGTPLQGSGVSANFRDLLVEVIGKVDNGSIDWSQFDHDGDGLVDFITFIQPEVDGACQTTNLWAHRFSLQGLGDSPIPTQTPWPGHSGQFIKINDYIIQSGQGGDGSCTAGEIMPVGTVAHETGHAFGLPDLYDTEPASGTEGIGEWGLMGSGNYARPYSPSRMEAWSLAQLGWVTVDTLSASGQVTINPVSSSDTVWYVPTARAGDYFLLENRDSLASDTAQMNSAFSTRKKSPGLLIWHIDDARVAQGTVLGQNSVNTGAIQGVALEQADGLNQLRTANLGNRGDIGDSYPGSTGNSSFTFSSNPQAADNTGAYAGFIIDSITRHASGVPGVASPMTLYYLLRGLSLIAPDANHASAQVKVNGVSTARYANAIAPGETVNLSVTSPQTANAGRSEFTFLSWSDGGASSHSFVSSVAGPDTVIATFTARHKVTLTSTPVGGTVTSDLAVPLDTLVAGTFVQENTPVTLSAAADANFLFTGWTGDTSTGNATVVLPMGRPYAVTAQFTATVVVASDDAANDLLTNRGCGCLTTTQRSFLDQAGNHNGVYDLGDFLAYANRSGLNPSSPAMQRVLSRLGAGTPAAARKER